MALGTPSKPSSSHPSTVQYAKPSTLGLSEARRDQTTSVDAESGGSAEARQTLITVRSDSAADWAAANPILAQGELGFAYDTNQLVTGNGTSAWVDLITANATQLAYAESTVVQSTIGATAVDITGLNITFTVTAGKPVYVVARTPTVYASANAAGTTLTVVLAITDIAGVKKRFGYATLAPNHFAAPITAIERITTPGTYYRKVQMYKTGTGTFNNGFTADDVAHILATTMPLPA